MRIIKKIIKNLERADRDETEYLSFDEIKRAFHKADFKLSTVQLKDLLFDITRNKDNNCKYTDLLRLMFGDDYRNTIVVKDRAVPPISQFEKSQSIEKKENTNKKTTKHRSKSGKRFDEDKLQKSHRSNRSKESNRQNSKSRVGSGRKSSSRKHRGSARKSLRKHSSKSKSHKKGSRSKSKKRTPRFKREENKSKNATSKSIRRDGSRPRKDKGKIARYIGRKLRHNKYDYVNHLKQYAGDDIDFVLTDRQIFKMTDAAGIKLSKSDKKDFVRDMERPNFSVEEFLISCELKTDEFQTLGLADEVVLTTEEEELAKKNLMKIGSAIEEDKKEFEDIFNLQPYDKTLSFSEFKYGLLNELNSDCANIANHDKTIMLLKNFLVQDINNDDKIEVKNLYVHLFPSGGDRQEVKTKMNCITDFIEYLKNNPDVDLEKEFKGMMTHEEFEEILHEIGYDVPKQNLEKLMEAFTSAKNPEKISKNLIKRNVNLLAPEILNTEKKVKKKDADTLIENLDKKSKITLIKINEYLKRERADTLTFFQY